MEIVKRNITSKIKLNKPNQYKTEKYNKRQKKKKNQTKTQKIGGKTENLTYQKEKPLK